MPTKDKCYRVLLIFHLKRQPDYKGQIIVCSQVSLIRRFDPLAVQLISSAFEHSVLSVLVRKFMLWIMWCYTLQSMGRTNHEFPVYIPIYTQYVQTQLKSSTVLRVLLLAHIVKQTHVTLSLKSGNLV